MIGHIKPKICKLPPGAKDEYMNLYCSICHSLRHKFGILGTLFINSELTMILLALRDHFAPGESHYRCPARLRFTSKTISIHRIVNLASEFSFLLGWLKVLDWETDKPVLYKKGIRKILDKKAGHILNSLSEESRRVIGEYHSLVTSNSSDFPHIREMSNMLSRTICIELGKQTDIDDSDLILLSDFFGRVGEMVAIADPLMDLRNDIQRREYNPIRESAIENSSQVSFEYEKHRSKYLSLESQIKSELVSLKLQNITNGSFITAMQTGLDRLSSLITRKRNEFPVCNPSGQTFPANFSTAFGFPNSSLSSSRHRADGFFLNSVSSILRFGKSSAYNFSQESGKEKKPKRNRGRIAANCAEDSECAEASCWFCCDWIYCLEGCSCRDSDGDGDCCDCDCS